MKVKCPVSHKRVQRKERREGQVYGEGRAGQKKLKETKWMEENPFVLRHTHHRRSGLSHSAGAQLRDGAVNCSRPELQTGNGV